MLIIYKSPLVIFKILHIIPVVNYAILHKKTFSFCFNFPKKVVASGNIFDYNLLKIIVFGIILPE